MPRWILVILALWWGVSATAAAPPSARIGSKEFTESVILAELARLDAQRHALLIEHRRALGGSAILWHALLEGSIDAYPAYTGTITQQVLHGLPDRASDELVRAALARIGLGMSSPLGFEDRYALGVTEALAR